MLIVLPFYNGDAPQLLNLLLWIKQLGGAKAHPALFVADAGVDWRYASQIRELAKDCFHSIQLITTEDSVTGWPQGANALFNRAAAHCREPWLWLEPDAIPLHPAWADIIAEEYAKCGKQFMGHIYDCAQPNLPKKMLSGVAVYPGGLHSLAPTGGEGWGEGAAVAFDVALASTLVPQAHHTVRIQHFWGEPDLPPTFPAPGQPMPRNGFTLAKLQGNAVIFHRNKDGTLIERLREARGLSNPQSAIRNPHSRGFLKVRRTASIGDVLSATVVTKKLTMLGYDVECQAHSSTHCVLRRIPGIKHICDPQGTVDIDLDGAYENHKNRRNFHFAQIWVDRANESLRTAIIPDAHNFAPRMAMTLNDTDTGLSAMLPFPRPWTIIVPRSQNWANRTVPDEIWSRAAAQIIGTKFWLGLHPAPVARVSLSPYPPFVDLNCRHFDTAIAYLGTADLCVTVDTGPMHVAAALGTPVVAIQQASSPELHLSDQQDFVMVSPALGCLNCQLDLCPLNSAVPPCQQIDPGVIARAANEKLRSVTDDGVSVVIPIYKPAAQKLNRALEHILPQVQEVVVVVDSAGFIPQGALQNSKVRYLRMKGRDLGLARKANYGFRHTNEKYLLWLNDDCYMAADAVAKMREVMGPTVGLVGCELRYPDGTIQHGGTYRPLGVPGWGHLDHRARESRIKAPVEMENVTGACVLIRRKAFYEAGGLDENFYLYCEDNDLCLAVRRAGWKVFYTPHARGLHEESQSTCITPNIREHMDRSNRYLHAKWKWYFDLNKSNSGMGVFE